MNKKITLLFICSLFALNTVFSQDETIFTGAASTTHNVTPNDVVANQYIRFFAGQTFYQNGGEPSGFTVGLDGSNIPFLSYNAPVGSNWDAVGFRVFDSNTNMQVGNDRSLVIITGDVTAPVITLNNPGTQTIEAGAAYTELNATASDVIDAGYTDDLTSDIIIDASAVNTNVVGSYSVTYNVTDKSGNPATTVTRTVDVIAATDPVISNIAMSSDNATSTLAKAGDVITLTFDSSETIVTPTVTIAGQSATVSNVGNAWTATIALSSGGTQGAAAYSISGIEDSFGNTATNQTGSGTVSIDTIPPTAIAQDLSVAADVHGQVTVTAAQVDNGSSDANGVSLSISHASFSCGISFVFGTPTLTVTDPAGNTATDTYAVTVIDNIKPVITVSGSLSVTIEVGSFYFVIADGSVSDNCGSVFVLLSGVGALDTNVVGVYEKKYNYTDSAGNAADEVVKTINVVDTTIPSISLVGDNPQTLEVHSDYAAQELGATASDNYDGDITGNIVIDASNVDMTMVGTYTVTYNVDDANTNSAVEVERTVHVVDTTKPVITLVGDNPQRIEYNEFYTELGATATDNYDDDTALTGTIVIDASNALAGIGTLGTYSVTYNVTDANNNIADSVTRTVIVEDTTKPVLTLIGDNPQLIEIIDGADAVYVEQGAIASDEYDVDVDDADIIIDTSALVLDTVGCYPVTYTVTDASGNTRVRTRTVFVLEEGKPWAKDNAYTVNQDSQNNMFNILSNDSFGTDGPNGTHPISLSGTYTDNGAKIDLVGNQVQYTPRPGFSGVDQFSYTITDENGDGSGDAASAQVTITVVLNPAPTAVNDVITVAENSGVTSIDVLDNDNYNTDGPAAVDALTVSGTSIEGGTITVNAGKVDYTPATDFTGLDSFMYTIKDANGDESTATVLITVTIDSSEPVAVPMAQPDAVTVNQNSANNVINVLSDNGSGADNFGTDGAIDDGLTLPNGTLTGASDQGGTVNIDNKGTLSTLDDEVLYTPKSGFIGTDSFKYMIIDATGDTSITIVTVTVLEIATPTAVADAVIVQQDSGVNAIDVLANDSFGSDGPAVAPSISLPLALSTNGGTIVENAGKVDYTPAGGFTGVDTFDYTITDGNGDTSTATVTVTVEAVSTDDKPTAQNDAVSVTQDSVDNIINILLDNGNGADSFGTDGANASHPISLSAAYTDNGGKLILNGTSVEYTPKSGFTGVDSFKYTITDTTGDGSTATVTITVTQMATPTAVADAQTVGQDSGANTIDVLANDSFGLDGAAASDSLTLPLALSTQGGTIVVNAGKVDYTPAASFSGTDTFDYVIKDASGDTSTATVTITVDATIVVNGIPMAKPDAVTFNQNSSNNIIDVLADNGNGVDDFGSDGAIDDGLTMSNGTLSGASDFGGVVSVDNKGTTTTLDDVILYSPKSGFIGTDQFKYMITDANGDTSITIVTITVSEIATPTAVDDAVSVVQDSGVNSIDVLANDSFGSDGSAALDLLTLATGTSNQGGTIVVNAGKIDYTPAVSFNGTDTFDYTIKDATGDISTATVTVTVSTVNTDNSPTAKDDVVTVNANSIDNTINILLDNGNGADSYGTDMAHPSHPISLSAAYTDNGGKLVLNGTAVEYTPRTGFTGVDNFSYTLTDADGDASVAQVTVNVVAPPASAELNFNSSSLADVFVYPNPSKGDFKVSVFSKKSEKVSIILFDVTGKVVYNNKQLLSEGNNTMDLNVSVKAGILFLKVTSSSKNYGITKIVFK